MFWEAARDTSYGNVMRYCLVYEANYSGVWTTAQTGDDFDFHHNVIADSHTAWVRDYNSTHHYHIHDCMFANNLKMTGNGIDKAIDNGFLTMDNIELSGKIEKDQSGVTICN